jgi:glycosyltransferase involved in cell wall biosynthesis
LLRRGVPSYKIFTAVNAVNNKKIQADCRKSLMKGNGKKIRQLLNAENKKMVLSVAYLSEKKGLQYLIKACGQLNKTRNDISLVIVGEGEYKNDLQSLADQNGINASFAGYVPDLATFPDLATYYLAADVFVLPTLRDVWGLVINEAMACGCPVITTRNAAGSRDLVKNGVNGYVVEEKNVKQLKNALEKILYDEVVKQRMKQASKDIIRNFSYENNAMGYKAAIAFSLESRLCRSRN